MSLYNFRLSILLIIAISLTAISIGLYQHLEIHDEYLELTDKAISTFEMNVNNLITEEDKDDYIEYLSSNIIKIRQDSALYVQDAFFTFSRLIYYLSGFALLQIIITVSLFFKKK